MNEENTKCTRNTFLPTTLEHRYNIDPSVLRITDIAVTQRDVLLVKQTSIYTLPSAPISIDRGTQPVTLSLHVCNTYV